MGASTAQPRRSGSKIEPPPPTWLGSPDKNSIDKMPVTRSQTRGRWVHHESLTTTRTKYHIIHNYLDVSGDPRFCPDSMPFEDWVEETGVMFYKTSQTRDVGYYVAWKNGEMVWARPVSYETGAMRVLGFGEKHAISVVKHKGRLCVKVSAVVDRDLDFHPPK